MLRLNIGVPQGFNLGPLFCSYTCMTNLPKVINNRSVPVLFADNTNILFSYSNFKGFEENINAVFETWNDFFLKKSIFSTLRKKHAVHF